MAVLELTVPGAAGNRPGPTKVSLASVAQAVQFDYIEADSTLSDLGRLWPTQDRPGRQALVQMGAQKLSKYEIKALFAALDPQQSVETSLLILKSLAHGRDPVVLSYGRLATHTLVTVTGYWVIEDCEIHVTARAQGSNEATQAEATIGLREANIPRWSRPASLARALPANNVGGASSTISANAAATPVGQLQTAAKTYVTGAGESLPQISLAAYGNPNLWRTIADANNILDPRNLLAGLRLLLP